MPHTIKSSVKTSDQKPKNVFYVWYNEICRRRNCNPAALLRPTKKRCNTVLDFAADRLKLDEWSPLLNALRQDTSLHVIIIKSRKATQHFSHDIDTEEKARSVRSKYGALSTDYTMNSLVKAISHSLQNTQLLTCLELDGLPIFPKYLESLMKALKVNKSVKYLSFNNCLIEDIGCHIVCSTLQLLSNMEVLNLSNCNLTSVSGMYIAEVIKSHRLNRYTSSWHNSLRCEEPDPDKMCGLRRITMNSNPKFGDEGLQPILNELEDDLWVKALDLQNCGITDKIANEILDILVYNKSLEIADFRKNTYLDISVIQVILEILRCKNAFDNHKRKFQWCSSVDSPCPSATPTSSEKNMRTIIDNPTTSQPLETNEKRDQIKSAVDLVRRNIENCATNRKTVDIARRKLLELNSRKVENVHKKKSISNFNVVKRSHISCNINEEGTVSHSSNSVLKTLSKWNHPGDEATEKAPKKLPNDTPFERKFSKCTDEVNKEPNVLETGCKIRKSPDVSRQNGAGNMFALYVDAHSDNSSTSSDDEVIHVATVENHKAYGGRLKKLELSSSQLSLFEYMEELEQDKV